MPHLLFIYIIAQWGTVSPISSLASARFRHRDTHIEYIVREIHGKYPLRLFFLIFGDILYSA